MDEVDVEARAPRVLARESSASAEESIATTCAPSSSSASASAIAPVPVPTSSTRGSFDVAQQLEAALDHDLRLGPRHERARVAAQRQAAKAPFAEDVRERLAGRAPFDQGGQTALSSSSWL